MLLQQFEQKGLSCSDIQLVIAIALDRLYFKDEAKVVSIQTLPESDAILNERFKDNVVLGTVHYFMTEKIFSKSVGKLNQGIAKYSLADLCPGITERDLLSEVYSIVCTVSREAFICMFYRTNHVRQCFFDHVRGKRWYSADGRANVLTEDVLDTIYNGFMEFFDKHSRSSYRTDTRNPLGFMKHCYSFYDRTNSDTHINPVNEIINIKSLDSPIGNSESNLTLLDFVDLEESDFSTDAIDFNSVATNIYRASKFLFNNRNENKAFYDIFSWYRDMVFVEQFKENKTIRSLRGNSTRFSKFNFRMIQEVDSFDSTTKNKFNARDAVCKAFKILLDNTLSTEEIYNLYSHVVKASVDVLSSNKKDGTPHYSYADKNFSVDARKTGKNCDKFKAEYEGFIALRDLLRFLNSKKNTLGISIFNMPTDIFRDPLLLKRFHSFKQYVLMNADVSSLLLEVQQDPIRNSLIYEGFNSNDRVYDILECMPKSQKLLQAISKVPLAKAEGILGPGNSSADRLKNKVDSVISYLRGLNISINEQYTYSNYASCEDPRRLATELVQVSGKIYQGTNNNTLKASDYFIFAIRYKNLVKALFHSFGREIVDSNGFYSLECSIKVEISRMCNVEELFSYLAPAGWTSDICLSLIDNAYDYLCSFLFGTSTLDNQNVLIIRDMFFSLDLVEAIISGFEKFMEHIYSRLSDVSGSIFVTPDNLFLLYAELISKYPILNLKPSVSAISDVLFLMEAYAISPYYLRGTDIPVVELYKERDTNVINGVNKYLRLCKSEFAFLNLLQSDIYRTLGHEKSFVVEDSRVLEILERANYNIVLGNQYKRSDISQTMEALFSFNELGFLVQLDKLYKTNNGNYPCYYHKYGYKVEITNAGFPDITELNKMELDTLRLMLGV